MPNFECLYFLENFYMYIIEVRLTEFSGDAAPTQRFRWLWIDKDSMEIKELTFAAMDSSGEIEERYFEEGYLKFNNSIGTLIEKFNSAQHPLNRRLDWKISTQLENTITDYFSTN